MLAAFVEKEMSLTLLTDVRRALY